MKRYFYLIAFISSMFIFSNSIYAYKEYKIRDEVKYNDVDFYVIKDSNSDSDNVILLKAEPLTVDEVNQYGAGHINKYDPSLGNLYDNHGYGGMVYYSSANCGWNGTQYLLDECTTDYASSDVKYVVDAWAFDKIKNNYIKSRIATVEEISNLGYEFFDNGSLIEWRVTENTPNWVYSENYSFWLQSPFNDSNENLYCVSTSGYLIRSWIASFQPAVRPVVELYKCAIDDTCVSDDDIIDGDNSKQSTETNKNNASNNVKVPNTLKTISGLVILIGLVITCISINIFIIFKNKDKVKK